MVVFGMDTIAEILSLNRTRRFGKRKLLEIRLGIELSLVFYRITGGRYFVSGNVKSVSKKYL